MCFMPGSGSDFAFICLVKLWKDIYIGLPFSIFESESPIKFISATTVTYGAVCYHF